MSHDKKEKAGRLAADAFSAFYEAEYEEKNRKDLEKAESYAQVVAREAEWKHGIFNGVEQIEIEYDGYPLRTPTRYVRSEFIGTMFLARTRALKKHIPQHPDIRPSTVLPGISTVMLAVCDNIVTDHGPNHSWMVGFPIRNPRHLGSWTPLDLIPGWEMFRQHVMERRGHSFLWRVGSDSWNSILTGVQLWGMSKFKSYLDFSKEGDFHEVVVSDDDGEMFTLRAREIKRMMDWKRPDLGLHMTNYNIKDRQVCSLDILAQPIRMSLSLKPGDIQVELSRTHPFADELLSVLVSTKPLGYAICEYSHILYEPSRVPPITMARFLPAHLNSTFVDASITANKGEHGHHRQGTKNLTPSRD
jgi:hypothetical protein